MKLLLLLFLSRILCVDNCLLKINTKIQHNGFHRQLNIDINVLSDTQTDDVILVYPVSSDVYIDQDEIESIKTLNYEIIFTSNIDTEQPKYLSNSHIVYVYFTLNAKRFNIEIPLHMRYQTPCVTYHYQFQLPQPVILIRQTSTLQNTISLPCSPLHNSIECNWLTCQYINQSYEPDNILYIPCGSVHHTHLILIFTLVFTSGVSLLLTALIILYFD